MKINVSLFSLFIVLTFFNKNVAFGQSCPLQDQDLDYLQEHTFVYRGRTLTPQELYGDFAQEVYQRLKSENPEYIKLLDYPDIIYRLDSFLSCAQQQLISDLDTLINEFKKTSGAYSLPPQTTRGGILFGDWPYLQEDTLGFIQDIMYRHGPDVVNLKLPFAGLFMQPQMFVLSPEIAQQVLQDTDGNIIKGDGSAPLRDQLFFPEGIVFMEANVRWGLLNKAFFEGPCNPKEFPERYGELFQENFSWLIQRWQNKKEPFNLHKEITYYTMRVMSNAFFNYTLKDEQLVAVTDAFYVILDVIHQRFASTINIPLIIPTPQNYAYSQALSVFNGVLSDIVAKAPDQIKIDGKKYNTMIGILRDHQLSHDEISSHVAMIFFAAHDTTANFITMLLYELYTRPEWQKKIRQEIDAKLTGRCKSWIPMGLLSDYTKFQDEVLRLYPSIPLIMVDTAREMILGGYTIPAHTTLGLAIYAIQRNPLYYKNPNQFNPHRVEPDNPDYTPYTKESFMTFSYGRRRCLGQWFAQAEARNLIAQLIDNNIDLTFFNNDQEVYLEMACTGMPNRVILAAIKEPKALHNNSHCIRDCSVKITDIRYEDQAQTIKTIRLEPINGNKLPSMYHPGDHLQLFWTDQQGKNTMRHFSISSSPTAGRDWVEITVKKEIQGVMSQFLHHELSIGDVLNMRMPLDDGVRVSEHDPIDRPLVLVSGGIGITPMMSIATYLCEKQWPGQIYFIHSTQSPDSLAFGDKLNDLAQKHDNFHLFIKMTRASGRITPETIATLGIKNICDARVYVCGNPVMCKDMANVLHKAFNISHSSIHQLSFGVLDWTKTAGITWTRSEVQKHNRRDDAWLIINGVVYDVTKYLALHPGLDIINDYLGQDATNVFNQIPHSADAKKLLSESDVITIKGVVV